MKFLISLPGIFLPIALTLCLTAHADNSVVGTVLNVDASFQNSENYTGSAYSVLGDHKFENGDHLLIGGQLFHRTFSDGTQLTDQGMTLGYVSTLNPHVYWENGLIVNPNANFTPLWSYATTPHYVIGNDDLSLGVSASRYKVLQAGTLSPRILHEFRYFQAGAGIYATRTYDDVIAYYGVVILNPIARQSVRVDYSFGRTIEDEGIETNYTNLTLSYKYQISGRWKIGPYASFFRGTIRNEDSYGIHLDIGL